MVNLRTALSISCRYAVELSQAPFNEWYEENLERLKNCGEKLSSEEMLDCLNVAQSRMLDAGENVFAMDDLSFRKSVGYFFVTS